MKKQHEPDEIFKSKENDYFIYKHFIINALQAS